MALQVKMEGKAQAVLQSPISSVRVVYHQRKTWFSIHDILQICGYNSTQWVHRKRGNIRVVKLPFRMMTRKGMRDTIMNFVDRNDALEALSVLACPPEKKKWLEENVFVFRFEAEDDDSPETEKLPVSNAIKAAAGTAEDIPRTRLSSEELNRKIDAILLQLLEMKKAVIDAILEEEPK